MRRTLFDDNAATPEGQPNPLLDEVADVAPAVKTHDRAGIAKHMSALMSLAVASSSRFPTRKTGVVVMLWSSSPAVTTGRAGCVGRPS